MLLTAVHSLQWNLAQFSQSARLKSGRIPVVINEVGFRVATFAAAKSGAYFLFIHMLHLLMECQIFHITVLM